MNLKPSELVKKIIKLSGLEHYWQKQRMSEELENAYELVSLAAQYDKQGGLEAFLDHVDLYSDQDALAGRRDGVRLMTVHAAKGLEFDCVFITGLEAGLFPHSGDESDRRKEEEERRLFYVAMTRARRELFLSFAYTRTIFGTQQVNTASEFLSEINPELIDQEEIVEAEERPRRRIELL